MRADIFHPLASPDCPICKGANFLILDALQFASARQRWPFDDRLARLGPGPNYCPCSHPSQRNSAPLVEAEKSV